MYIYVYIYLHGPVWLQWLQWGPVWLQWEPVWLQWGPVWLQWVPVWLQWEPVWLQSRFCCSPCTHSTLNSPNADILKVSVMSPDHTIGAGACGHAALDHIYAPGSSARFARAEAHKITLWDYITGLYHGIILLDTIMGSYYSIVLMDCTTGKYYRIVIQYHITESHYGMILWNHIMDSSL